MIKLCSRSWFIVPTAGVLIACGGGESSSGSGGPSSRDVVGIVTNGPIFGATVTVTDLDGEQVFENSSDPTGRFYAQVPSAGTFHFRSSGGFLDGASYQADLEAWCHTSDDGCAITPYSTGIAQVMEAGGFNLGDVTPLIRDRFGLDGDPFADDDVAESFDLAAARSAIDGGAGLANWLNAFVAYALQQSDTLPAGFLAGGTSSGDDVENSDELEPPWGMREIPTPEHHSESYDPDVSCRTFEVIGPPIWLSTCSYSSGGSGFYVYENRGSVDADICFEITFYQADPFTGCRFGLKSGDYSSGSCFSCGTNNGGSSGIELTKYEAL